MYNEHLNLLEEGKTYIFTFDIHDIARQQNLICAKVLINLDNSIKLINIDTNEYKWYNSTIAIHIFDEVPLKYSRKEKLKKLEKNNEK